MKQHFAVRYMRRMMVLIGTQTLKNMGICCVPFDIQRETRYWIMCSLKVTDSLWLFECTGCTKWLTYLILLTVVYTIKWLNIFANYISCPFFNQKCAFIYLFVYILGLVLHMATVSFSQSQYIECVPVDATKSYKSWHWQMVAASLRLHACHEKSSD